MLCKWGHLFLLANYVLSIWYDLKFVKAPILRMNDQVGRLKYLTFWNMILQAIFFTICFLNDLIGTNEDDPKKPPAIRKLKDKLFVSLAFPVSMFVGLTFWGIYFVDRELVFPRVLDAYFPWWLNHVMHTNIMIFIVLELATSFRKYPDRKTGLTTLIGFMLTYLVWIHIIHHYSGLWVYPVLDALNLPFRLVFFLVLLGLIVGLYLVGEKLNNYIWSKNMVAISERRTKAN